DRIPKTRFVTSVRPLHDSWRLTSSPRTSRYLSISSARSFGRARHEPQIERTFRASDTDSPRLSRTGFEPRARTHITLPATLDDAFIVWTAFSFLFCFQRAARSLGV